MNSLIIYPRSGLMWTDNRLRMFQSMYKDEVGLRVPLKNRIRLTHAGFHPHDPPEGVKWSPPEGGRVYLLLRDARQAVVSVWYWLQRSLEAFEGRGKIPRNVRPVLEEYPIPDNLSDFLRSPIGVYKFQQFLERMNDLPIDRVFFYEEAAGPEFIRAFSDMVGIDFKPSDKFVQRIIDANKGFVNLMGADHSKTSKEDLEYIQEELQKSCALPAYHVGYL